MKTLFVLLLYFLFIGLLTAQTDRNGNPVFNSVTTGEEALEEFTLIANYYTLNNNIENKNSSVFISSQPTLDQIGTAALDLPSDFFILTKGSRMINMLMIVNKPKRSFLLVHPNSPEPIQYKCKLKGDISENRAKEIIKENFDSSARIENGRLYFNGNKYKIISNEEIRKAVVDLIKREKLTNLTASDAKLLSQEEIKEVVLRESKEGGTLDFFTEIKGKEYDGVQVKPGVFTSKVSVALYKWGRANFDLGVNTVEDAYALYAELKSRNINEMEKAFIKMGFDKEWEK